MKFAALFLTALAVCAMPAIAETTTATVRPATTPTLFTLPTTRTTPARIVKPAGITMNPAVGKVAGTVKPVGLPGPIAVKIERTGAPKRAF